VLHTELVGILASEAGPGHRQLLLQQPCTSTDWQETLTHPHLFVGLEEQEQLDETRRILHEELPPDNYAVLKRIIEFLGKVSPMTTLTVMTVKLT